MDDARPWLRQGASDARTATALANAPSPMLSGDVGCHVAALCAQAVEKSLKGYVFLNGSSPAFDHRPDGYLAPLLRGDKLLCYRGHQATLAKLFDPTTKAVIKKLLDLTPGGLGNGADLPNTEYPWTDAARVRFTPSEAVDFSDAATSKAWLATAKRVSEMLHKLWIAVDSVTAS